MVQSSVLLFRFLRLLFYVVGIVLFSAPLWSEPNTGKFIQVTYGQDEQQVSVAHQILPLLEGELSGSSHDTIEEKIKALTYKIQTWPDYSGDEKSGAQVIFLLRESSNQDLYSQVFQLLLQKGYSPQILRYPEEIQMGELVQISQEIIKANELKNPEKNQNSVQESLKEKVKSWWEQKYTPPTNEEKWMGRIIVATRAAITSKVWLSLEGIDPVLASSVVALITLYDYYSIVYSRTRENILSGDQSNERLGFKHKRTWEILRNKFFYYFFIAYTVRMLSGPVGGAEAAFSVEGLLQTLNYSFLMMPFHWFTTEKHHTLSRRASFWVGLPMIMSGMYLSNLYFAGESFFEFLKITPITHMETVFYTVTSPGGVLLMSNLLAALAVRYVPSKHFESYANFLTDFIKRVRDLIVRIDPSYRARRYRFEPVGSLQEISSRASKGLSCRRLFGTS